MRITRADAALTEMKRQLDWLREKRSPIGHKWHETDLAREIGFVEAMDILRAHGARLVETGGTDAKGSYDASQPFDSRTDR